MVRSINALSLRQCEWLAIVGIKVKKSGFSEFCSVADIQY